MTRLLITTACGLALLIAKPQTLPADEPPGPLAPNDERATFKLAKGFTIELAASEPDVVDPVAMCFDEKGRLFVCEDRKSVV